MAKNYAGKNTLAYLVQLIKTELGKKVATTDIVNDLKTNESNKPLSAAQGKALSDKIDALPTGGGDMQKSVYDTDGDNKVDEAKHAESADSATSAGSAAKADDADKLGGELPSAYAKTGDAKTYVDGLKGQADGLCPLDGSKQISSEYLPSFVDDVVEGYYKPDDGKFYNSAEDQDESHEIKGEKGKIYVDITDGSGGGSYRYSGSVFTAIVSSDMVEIDNGEIDGIWNAAV